MILALAMVLAAAPLKVASTDWKTSGVDPTLAAVLEGRFLQLLREEGIQVISSKDVEAFVGLDRQKQLLGCATESCSAELAGALGVDALLLASVAQAGSGYSLSLRAISATNAIPVSTLSGRVRSLDELQDWLDGSAKKMAAELKGEAPAAQPVADGPRAVRWIPAISGAVLAIAGVVVFLERSGPAQELQTRVFPDQPSVAATRATGETFEKLGIVLMAVGAAAIATSVIWASVAPAKASVIVAPIPGGATVAVGLVFP